MGEITIEKFWVSYRPGQRPKVYTFEAYEANAGYYYFKGYKSNTEMLSKKWHELYQPDFRPMVLNGGKNTQQAA